MSKKVKKRRRIPGIVSVMSKQDIIDALNEATATPPDMGIEKQISFIEGEIEARRSLNEKMIKAKKLGRKNAELTLRMMQAIVETLCYAKYSQSKTKEK